MLSVVRMNVVMLSAVAPLFSHNAEYTKRHRYGERFLVTVATNSVILLSVVVQCKTTTINLSNDFCFLQFYSSKKSEEYNFHYLKGKYCKTF